MENKIIKSLKFIIIIFTIIHFIFVAYTINLFHYFGEIFLLFVPIFFIIGNAIYGIITFSLIILMLLIVFYFIIIFLIFKFRIKHKKLYLCIYIWWALYLAILFISPEAGEHFKEIEKDRKYYYSVFLNLHSLNNKNYKK